LRTAIAAVWAVIVCSFFIQAANALQTDLISLKADGVFRAGIIGLLMASYYAGYVVAPFLGRVVIGRIGHVNTVIVAMAAPAAVILLQPLLVTTPAWLVFRALSGIALSLSYVAVESWINDSVPNGLRGRVFSLYMFAQLIGMTVAQGLLSLGAPSDYGMFVLAAALFLAAIVPVLIARGNAPAAAPPNPLSIATLFRLSPMGVIATLLAGLTWSTLFTFGPVYAKRVGFDMAGIGLFMAVAVAAGGALQMPVGWLSDRIGRRPVLLLLFGVGSVACLFGVVANGTLLYLVAAALSGACIFPIYAVSTAAVNDHVTPEQRVAAAAGLVLLFGAGSIFGPLLCGSVIGVAGAYGFYALLAVAMASGFVVTLAVAPKR
jgi:MFS family permease